VGINNAFNTHSLTDDHKSVKTGRVIGKERLSAVLSEGAGGREHELLPLPHMSLSEEPSLDEPGRIRGP